MSATPEGSAERGMRSKVGAPSVGGYSAATLLTADWQQPLSSRSLLRSSRRKPGAKLPSRMGAFQDAAPALGGVDLGQLPDSAWAPAFAGMSGAEMARDHLNAEAVRAAQGVLDAF